LQRRRKCSSQSPSVQECKSIGDPFDSISRPGHHYQVPCPGFLDFKEQNNTFEDVIGLAYTNVHLRGSQGTEEFSGGWVTPNTFDFLGIEPFLGRRVTQQDGKPGSPPVFVMSYILWSRLFHRDPKILGATLNLNGTPRTLIAIMPPRFRFGDCEVWLPLELNRSTFITGFGLQPNELWVVGRLKSGVSLQTASADLEVVAQRLEKMFPAWFRAGYRLEINSLTSESVGASK
jgi:putative ABC transport system permease protein